MGTIKNWVQSYSINGTELFNSSPILPISCTITLPDYQEFQKSNFATMIILGVFSVIGTIGNGLVIYVYTHKKDKLTSSVFILALAGTDIITCSIVIPYTIVAINKSSRLIYDAACKIYYFLITSNVPLSAFIMAAIAVDRYLCICHPFRYIMTVERAKTIVSLLGAFACVLGLITALSFDVYQYPKDLIDIGVNITDTNLLRECEILYTGGCHQSSKILSNSFSLIYQKIYSSFYLVSILVVTVLYALIYRSVTSQRAKRQKQKRKKPATAGTSLNPGHCQDKPKFSTTMVQTDEQPNTVTTSSTGSSVNLKVDAKENGNSCKTETHKLNNGETVPLKSHKHSGKEKKDHIHLANIKTAIMLGVVTIVFTVAFLPAWLMALEWVQYQPFIFYMYFIYNVANPVIYAFMNPLFRQDLIKLFQCS